MKPNVLRSDELTQLKTPYIAEPVADEMLK